MRESFMNFLKVCLDVRLFLQAESFVVHYEIDGAYADFCSKTLNKPQILNGHLQGFEYIIFSNGDKLIIRVFESYEDMPY